MNNLKKIIKNNIREFLNEDYSTQNIKHILLKRIPFLKEYDIFEHPRNNDRLEAKKISYNENVNFLIGNDVVNFPIFNISSEVTYYPHKVYENNFHLFIIKNSFHVKKPDSMVDLEYKVFLHGLKQVGQNLSYSKEIVVKDDEKIPKEKLDNVINEMNGVLFDIENFTQQHSIDLF